MRKFVVAIVSLLVAFVLSFSTLAGCGLVEVNNEKDMNQLVATVSIGEGAPKDEIYKKDLIIAYLNYYYMYEQYYGYTRAQTFQLILDSLINNRVYLQNAIKQFAGEGADIDWTGEKYLTEEEKAEALYSAYKDMNDLIANYEEHNHGASSSDTAIESTRVVPTGAENATELSKEEKAEYVAEGIDTNSTDSIRKAYAEVINVLKANDLLGDEYEKNPVITNTEYYKETLKNYHESLLVERYNKQITDNARKQVTFEMLEAEYAKLYAKQSAWSNSEFVSALDSLSASAPIVYSGYKGYGLVYNLLLGASEELIEELNDWDEENPNASKAERNAKRAEIFSKITVKDLRSSWIHAGYDFEQKEGSSEYVFTGDYTLTSAENSLPYKGTVTDITHAHEEEEGEHAHEIVNEYRAESTEMGLSEFIAMMEQYVYGKTINAEVKDGMEYNTSTALDEYDQRVKELMFAFSTDDSDTALNTYKGYAIKPTPDGGESETYMQEFADAGRKLLTMGANSYVMVATDYGYHIMFLSEVFDTNYKYATLTEYLNKEYGEKDWSAELDSMLADWEEADTNHYLYILHNSLSSSIVTKAQTDAQNKVLNTYVYAGDYVVIYKDTIADLLG